VFFIFLSLIISFLLFLFSFRRFLGTPEAMHLMRSPSAGVPPSRFRPPVYVTIWS